MVLSVAKSSDMGQQTSRLLSVNVLPSFSLVDFGVWAFAWA